MGIWLKKRVLYESLAITILVLLCTTFASAASVTRSFSKTTCSPSEVITVTLNINVDSANEVYAVDETYPTGWAITANPNGGFTDQANHIKFLEYTNPVDIIVSYSIRAPATAGSYLFSGIWMVDGFDNPSAVGGDDTVTVSSSPIEFSCDNYTTITTCNAQSNCTWCDMYSPSPKCIDSSDFDCSAAGCNGIDEYCHNCEWRFCPIDRECDVGQCILPVTPTPTPTASPSPTGSPTPTPPPCDEVWSCGDWSTCSGSIQTRTCTDSNNCGTTNDRPSIRRRCSADGSDPADPDASPTSTSARRRTDTTTDDDDDGINTDETRSRDDVTSGSDGTGRSRTTADSFATPDPDSTTDDTGPASSGMLDYLFYVLIIVMVLLGGGFLFYYVSTKNKKGGGKNPPEQNNLFMNQQSGSGPSGGTAPSSPPSIPSSGGDDLPPGSGKF